jgi:hypothetical protein
MANGGRATIVIYEGARGYGLLFEHEYSALDDPDTLIARVYPAGICDCGSGEPWEREFDAQGIYLCRCCDKCRRDKLGRYRPEILAGYGQEDVNEPIEAEE